MLVSLCYHFAFVLSLVKKLSIAYGSTMRLDVVQLVDLNRSLLEKLQTDYILVNSSCFLVLALMLVHVRE